MAKTRSKCPLRNVTVMGIYKLQIQVCEIPLKINSLRLRVSFLSLVRLLALNLEKKDISEKSRKYRQAAQSSTRGHFQIHAFHLKNKNACEGRFSEQRNTHNLSLILLVFCA